MLATLRYTKPTEFVAVPRVYEKFKEVIEMRARLSNGMVLSMYEWAKSKGYLNTLSMVQGEPSPFGYNLAKLLVLKKIKMELGLDGIENAYFGAAPMS
jgi:long-subunit acyl-CoA synthetase (AMP-forming)